MKLFKLVFANVLFALCFITNSCSQKTATGASSVLGVFIASTPCDQIPRPLLKIPADFKCEFIRWNLTLYQDAQSHAPTSYLLTCVYGLPKQGTRGFIDGGTKVEVKGNWKIVRG